MDETAETMDVRPCPVCGRRNATDARFCGGCGQVLVEEGEAKADVADPLIGQVIADRYRIVALLGRGGMGVVYKVEHVHIGKLMAMKLLHGELARDRNTVKRFQREADAASRLNHPNTVQVFDFGRSDGLMYLVMEFLEGKDLGQLVREAGHLDFGRVARLCAQVCASVTEAHDLGIVHRDLKPENIMVLKGSGEHEIAKVLDFGLAKLRDHTGGITVTRAGAIVGTPYYMSPEQIRGEEVDSRGDVYAIGAMIYKAATGVPPYVANTPMGVLTKHLTEPLVLPSRRSGFHLPPSADSIVAKAMEKDAADRYQSAEELRQALLGYLNETGELNSQSSMKSFAKPVAVDAAFATRKDVDAYERKMKRTSVLTYIVILMLLAGLGAAGWWGYNKYATTPSIPSAEAEPNNEPEQANDLPASVEVSGTIGQRQDTELGDVDLYRIRNVEGRRLLRVSLSALPNMDLMLDVIRMGQRNPVLSADSGGVGHAESVPNFPISNGEYLLRVRERWITGQLPTENISDRYTIKWELAQMEDGWENEVNDSLELANNVALGSEVRGYVGWAGDVDTYCLQDTAPGVHVELSPINGVDGVLRVVRRARASSRKFDSAGLTAAETLHVEGSDDLCIEVSADETEEAALRANAENAYTITFRAGDAPVVEP